MLRWLFGPREIDPVVKEALASQRELITSLSERLAKETSRADKAEAEAAARLEDLRKLNLLLAERRAAVAQAAQGPATDPERPITSSAIIAALDAAQGKAQKFTSDDRPPAFANGSVGGGHFFRPKPEDERRPTPDTVAQA